MNLLPNYCEICGDWVEYEEDGTFCPTCGKLVCMMCYSTDVGVCDECKKVGENMNIDPEEYVLENQLRLHYGASGVSGADE